MLNFLYSRVIVPYEVAAEVRAGGKAGFAVDVFKNAHGLDIQDRAVVLQPFLRNSLDPGEASVIQTAMDMGLSLVCIDEVAGRRIARLCGLDLTGSVGVLIKAKRLGFSVSIPDALQRMHHHGIWLSEQIVRFALAQA